MIRDKGRFPPKDPQKGVFASAYFNPDTHARMIQESHLRSKEYGIDPHLDKAPAEHLLSPEQLKKRIRDNQPFFDLVTTQMSALYQILEGSGFCMAVADSEGYVLRTLGDAHLIEHFNRRNFSPGYRWTEKDMGTCAIGLVLYYGIPFQVSGEEMFSLGAQHITNSAAPVYDNDGTLLGVIALSGLAEHVHSHTLGLVIQAADTIRSRIGEMEKSRELALKNQHMSSLLESDHRGVISLDQSGRIVKASKKARMLLRLDDSCENGRIDDLLHSRIKLVDYLAEGRSFSEREITFTVEDVSRTLICTLDPITMPDGECAGGLLLLMEPQRLMKFANEMAGSQARFTFDSIIGNSESITEALKFASIAARGAASVLLSGETGTGKELFAQAIHNAGPRRDKPFVVINCGAIPRELLESELFGYEEGAFTGAQKGGRPGKIELADGGSLFLDEIGDMPIDMQVKLLRALQSHEIQRVGGFRQVPVDIRIISATNLDLEKAISQKLFRKDLYYRISTLRINIPPLRERKDDVRLLANVFLKRIRQALDKPDLEFSSKALRLMGDYSWPGNIRQLENTVERAVNIADGRAIQPQDLGLGTVKSVNPRHAGEKDALLEDLERGLISSHMEKHQGNISKVARLLGVSRPTLYRKLKKYELEFKPSKRM